MPEMHLRQPVFKYIYLLQIKKEQKKLKKQEIRDIFIKIN